MNGIIWKKFILSDIFSRNTPPSTNVTAKELNIFEEQADGLIPLITRAETNNGIRGFIEKGDFPTEKNVITYNDQFSFFLYHEYEFTTIKDHLSVIKAKNDNFDKLLKEYNYVNIFIVTILNHIFSKEIFNFNFTGADYRFDREIILLPCLEVGEGEDYIWEENGKHYTLAVEYIKKLMDEAKELREQKTIRLYEAERAKYEAERAKYEAGYKKDRDVLVWKGFKLDDLYLFDSSKQYPFTQKQVDMTTDKDEEHDIAVIAQSAQNNGIIGYINRNEDTEKYTFNDSMTFSMNFGICFYHPYDYLLLDTHGSIFRLIAKNTEFAKVTKGNLEVNLYLAKMIDKICSKSLYDWQWKPNSQRAGREIILLPCLEVGEGEDYIWEENGKHYTLAVEYISYVYLTGRVNYNQKRIDNYTYQY